MAQVFLSTVLMTALGMALRLWFLYASTKAIRGPRRGSRQEHDEYGLSFDERVAKRLSEITPDAPSPPRESGFGRRQI